MNERPKEYSQVRAIWAIAREKGIDSDLLHEIVAEVLVSTGSGSDRVASISALTYSEANRVIERLKGNAYVPLRTLQARRQRAGVKQVVTREMLKKITELAAQRNWSVMSLRNFCIRQCGHSKPRTTEDANKIIEALKAMNKREGLCAA